MGESGKECLNFDARSFYLPTALDAKKLFSYFSWISSFCVSGKVWEEDVLCEMGLLLEVLVHAQVGEVLHVGGNFGQGLLGAKVNQS